MANWLLKNKKTDLKRMSQVCGVSEIVCQVILNRNIKNKDLVNKFLNPNINFFNDITLMSGLDEAIDILIDAIDNGEKIAIYGDYDVDGTMSTSILYKGIVSLGGNALYYIPDRKEEGYGLNIKAIQNLKEMDVDLLITCDNGIASIEEIDYANKIDLKTIVIDHHETSIIDKEVEKEEILPRSTALIDPKQSNCNYPFKQMCAAGICYRFIVELFKKKNKKIEIHDEILVLAMIATFCDIVDLNEDNRIITKNGLEILNKNKNINLGLKKLIIETNCQDKFITENIIGFIIGPCINAAGRLENASKVIELFTTNDGYRAEILAKELVDLNEKRKSLTKKGVDSAINYINENNVKDNILVIYDETIHESVAGIIAGRIKDMLYKPTIVITNSSDCAKGSARSVEGYNIFEALSSCKSLFNRFGGHTMAAGLSLDYNNINLLREKLNSDFDPNTKLEETLKIEKELYLDEITYKLYEELSILKPFGKSNKEPLFGSKNIALSELRIIENKNTIIMIMDIPNSYRKLKGICFGKVEYLKNMLREEFDDYDYEKIINGVLRNIDLKLDIVYYIDINEYKGDINVQLKIIDFRISK